MFKRPMSPQRGVALISVLLIVAILLAITSRLLASHNLVINQHQNTFEQDQALHYALGAETLASQALFQDFTTLGPGVDHLQEVWAQTVLPFELDEGGFLEAQLRDLNGCFNFNSLVGAAASDNTVRAKTLLNNLNLTPQLVDAWKDWIDADDVVTGFGAEDNEYLLAQIPHRTPNRPVLSLSEMYLLQGADVAQLRELLPHICLLPDTDSRINVNTANAQTLASLDRGISIASAETIVAADRAFNSVTEFTDSNPDFVPVAAALSVTSNYFELHAQAQVGSSSVTLLSLLYRDPSNGEVTVLARDFGKLFRSNLTLNTTTTGP